MKKSQPTFDHVAFLKDPEKWPNWPICPVKHETQRGTNGMRRLGIVLAHTNTHLVLYPDVNMLSIPTNLYDGQTMSASEIVLAGWRVD